MPTIKKTFGQQTYGGGSGGAGGTTVMDSNLYYLIGGNSLPFAGANGVLKVTTAITTAASGWSNGVPATLPDGIGWIRSLDSNLIKLCVNDSASYTSYDLPSQPVYAVKTGTLSGGTSGAFWSYDKYTIVGAF